jgi:hypothetical protein
VHGGLKALVANCSGTVPVEGNASAFSAPMGSDAVINPSIHRDTSSSDGQGMMDTALYGRPNASC